MDDGIARDLTVDRVDVAVLHDDLTVVCNGAVDGDKAPDTDRAVILNMTSELHLIAQLHLAAVDHIHILKGMLLPLPEVEIQVTVVLDAAAAKGKVALCVHKPCILRDRDLTVVKPETAQIHQLAPCHINVLSLQLNAAEIDKATTIDLDVFHLSEVRMVEEPCIIDDDLTALHLASVQPDTAVFHDDIAVHR